MKLIRNNNISSTRCVLVKLPKATISQTTKSDKHQAKVKLHKANNDESSTSKTDNQNQR